MKHRIVLNPNYYLFYVIEKQIIISNRLASKVISYDEPSFLRLATMRCLNSNQFNFCVFPDSINTPCTRVLAAKILNGFLRILFDYAHNCIFINVLLC